MFQGNAITLEYRLTVGDTMRYRSSVTSTQSVKEEGQEPRQTESVISMVMDQYVRNVKDGIGDLDITILEGSMKRGLEENELPSVGQKISITMDRTGDIKKTSIGFNYSQPSFPSRPLRIGDSWSSNVPMEIPAGDQGTPKRTTLVYTYILSRLDIYEGHEVAVVEVCCPEKQIPIGKGVLQTISAKGLTLFSHSEGRLIKSTVETNTHITAPDASVDTCIKVELNLETSGSAELDNPILGQQESFIIGM